MDVDKGMWYTIVNGLAWTYEAVGGAAGTVGEGLGVVGDGLGESFVANAAAAGGGIRDGLGRPLLTLPRPVPAVLLGTVLALPLVVSRFFSGI